MGMRRAVDSHSAVCLALTRAINPAHTAKPIDRAVVLGNIHDRLITAGPATPAA
jgi:hypothetical protein